MPLPPYIRRHHQSSGRKRGIERVRRIPFMRSCSINLLKAFIPSSQVERGFFESLLRAPSRPVVLVSEMSAIMMREKNLPVAPLGSVDMAIELRSPTVTVWTLGTFHSSFNFSAHRKTPSSLRSFPAANTKSGRAVSGYLLKMYCEAEALSKSMGSMTTESLVGTALMRCCSHASLMWFAQSPACRLAESSLSVGLL